MRDISYSPKRSFLRSFAKSLLFYLGAVCWRIKQLFSRLSWRLRDFSPKRILLIRTKGLGDVVRTLPALCGLRERFPQARIDYCTSEVGKSLIKYHPAVKQIWTPDELGAEFKSGRAEYDLVVNFHTFDNDPAVRELMKNARGRVVVGRRHDRRGRYRYDENLYVNSWSELFCRMVHVPYQKGKLGQFQIHLPENADQIQRDILDRYGLEKGRCHIGLCLGNDEVRNSSAWARNYSVDYFIDLAAKIQTIGRVVLFGVSSDRCDEERARLRDIGLILPDAINLIDKPNFGDLLYIIRGLDALVTSDTGPLHFAIGLATPVIGLCGPTSVRELYDPPIARGFRLFQSHLSCSPCQDDFCAGCEKDRRAICMDRFEWEDIRSALKEIIL